MSLNVGGIDRVIRAIAGIVLIALPFMTGFGADSSLLKWGAVIVGLILAGTAAMGMCPIYKLLGTKTTRG